MKRYISFIAAFLIVTSFCASASSNDRKKAHDRRDTLMADAASLAYLDTIDVKKKNVINDYTMIGIQYGMAMSQVMWNPSMKQDFLFVPYNFGIMYMGNYCPFLTYGGTGTIVTYVLMGIMLSICRYQNTAPERRTAGSLFGIRRPVEKMKG